MKLRALASMRKPTHDEIAAAAYHLYLEHGCQHGHDMEDWLRAERLLRGQYAQAPLELSVNTSSASTKPEAPVRPLRAPARATRPHRSAKAVVA